MQRKRKQQLQVAHSQDWRWLTPAEAAEVLGVSQAFLAKDRRTKKQIPCTRIGDLARYRSDLLRDLGNK